MRATLPVLAAALVLSAFAPTGAGAAKKRSAQSSTRPPQDSVVWVPRVSRPPDLEVFLGGTRREGKEQKKSRTPGTAPDEGTRTDLASPESAAASTASAGFAVPPTPAAASATSATATAAAVVAPTVAATATETPGGPAAEAPVPAGSEAPHQIEWAAPDTVKVAQTSPPAGRTPAGGVPVEHPPDRPRSYDPPQSLAEGGASKAFAPSAMESAPSASAIRPASPAPSRRDPWWAGEDAILQLLAASAAALMVWIAFGWLRARARRLRTVGPAEAGVKGAGPGSERIRRMILANLWRVKGSVVLAALFMVGGAAVELLKPWPLKVILDHVILAKPLPEGLAFLHGLPQSGIDLLVASSLAIVLISLFGGLFSYFEVFIAKAIGIRMVYAVRREVFSHLQRLSLSFHTRARSGDLLTTFAKDTHTLKDVFAEALLKFADHFLSVAGMLLILWWVNWKMALIALASLPFLAYTLLHLYRQTKLSLKRQRRQEGKVTSRMTEVLAAVPLVQAFSREKHEEERYEEVSNETLRESIRMTRLEAAASRSSHILTAVGTAATVLFGGMEVLRGNMLPGDLVLVMSYLSSMYKPIRQLAKLSIDFSKASASAERIAEVLEVEPEINDLPDAIEADQVKGRIAFSQVSFDYGDGRDVLRRVSFEVEPGRRVALVGVSGAGKSTIASLMLRLYEAQDGAILIDGVSIERYRRESLRRQIGIVLQQSVLFGATIRENIAYGKPDASDEEIVAAARAANADEFIRGLEDGYDSVIGERGATLSAGQRQRIAIARTIIRDPRILILDEPMTGLDAESESRVREALDRLMAGKTTIMITHDLQSIADADQVLVLEDGRIAERGTHFELIHGSGRYRRLFDLGRSLDPAQRASA